MRRLQVNWIHYDATSIVEDPILAELDAGITRCTFAVDRTGAIMQSMHESVASMMDAEPRSDCLMPPRPLSVTHLPRGGNGGETIEKIVGYLIV